MTGKALDLSEQKFGELTAMYPEVREKKRGWVCSCSCGNSKWYATFQLTNGNAKTCGSVVHKVPYSINEKIGKLTIKSFYRDEKNRRWMAECECDCGNTKEASIRNLQRGATTHCGCSPTHHNRGKPEGVSIRNSLISSYRGGAKAKNLEFTLTEEDCISLFEGECYFCGAPPAPRKRKGLKGEYKANGIDRIDSTKGYTQDNVNSCCTDCNMLKSNKTNEEFMNHIRAIVEHTDLMSIIDYCPDDK
jgi:hypothetical protein